jgi:hypothetical protein
LGTIAYNYRGDTIFASVADGMLSDSTQTDVFMIPLGVTFVGTSVHGWIHETHLFNYVLLATLIGHSPEEVFELAGDFVARCGEVWIPQLGGH